jgi:hypothetical protein
MRTQEAGHAACALLQAMPGSAGGLILRDEPAWFDDAEHEIAMPGGPAGAGVAIRMTCVDRAVIKIHFRTRRSDETNGRSGSHRRRRQLCGHWLPGWRLPFKLRVERLPAELESKLSALEPGYTRVQVNGDVLLIDASTRRVFDVMQNVDAMMM